MKAREIMNAEIISLNPDNTVKKGLQVMNDRGINGAPIVDKDNILLGFVVKADIYRFLIEEGHYDTYPISSIMTTKVIDADIDDEGIDIAQKIVDNNIVAIPVIEDGKVVGLISIEDMVKEFIKQN